MVGTLNRQVKLWAFIAALFLSGVALVYLRFDDKYEIGNTQPWLWAIAIAGFALADLTVVRLHFRAETTAFSFVELPLFLGAIYLAPTVAWISITAGVAISVAVQRLAPMKALFNIANLSFQGALGLWLFGLILGNADPVGPTVWLAAAVAGAVSSAWAMMSLFVVLRIVQGQYAITKASQMFFMGTLTGVTNVSLALLAANLVESGPSALVLLVMPTAVLFGAYRAYTSEQSQRDRVVAMHELALEARSIRDHAGIVPVLRGIAKHLGAYRASLVLFPDQGSHGHAIRFSIAGDQSKVTEVVSAELAYVIDDVHSLETPTLRKSAESQGSEVAGSIQGTARSLGMLVVSDRLRDASDFSKADVVMFETIIEQLAQTFEKNELDKEVTRLENRRQELQHEASHDVLTGVANRSLLAARLDEELAMRREPSLLYVDIDDFKHINDRYGHDVGDTVLVEFARRFSTAVGPDSCVARLGGDEFAVLLHEDSDDIAVANRLLDLASQPISTPDGQVFAHASIGLARASEGGDVHTLLRRADLAMYDAKSKGKGKLMLAMADAI